MPLTQLSASQIHISATSSLRRTAHLHPHGAPAVRSARSPPPACPTPSLHRVTIASRLELSRAQRLRVGCAPISRPPQWPQTARRSACRARRWARAWGGASGFPCAGGARGPAARKALEMEHGRKQRGVGRGAMGRSGRDCGVSSNANVTSGTRLHLLQVLSRSSNRRCGRERERGSLQRPCIPQVFVKVAWCPKCQGRQHGKDSMLRYSNSRRPWAPRSYF